MVEIISDFILFILFSLVWRVEKWFSYNNVLQQFASSWEKNLADKIFSSGTPI